MKCNSCNSETSTDFAPLACRYREQCREQNLDYAKCGFRKNSILCSGCVDKIHQREKCIWLPMHPYPNFESSTIYDLTRDQYHEIINLREKIDQIKMVVASHKNRLADGMNSESSAVSALNAVELCLRTHYIAETK